MIYWNLFEQRYERSLSYLQAVSSSADSRRAVGSYGLSLIWFRMWSTFICHVLSANIRIIQVLTRCRPNGDIGILRMGCVHFSCLLSVLFLHFVCFPVIFSEIFSCICYRKDVNIKIYFNRGSGTHQGFSSKSMSLLSSANRSSLYELRLPNVIISFQSQTTVWHSIYAFRLKTQCVMPFFPDCTQMYKHTHTR